MEASSAATTGTCKEGMYTPPEFSPLCLSRTEAIVDEWFQGWGGRDGHPASTTDFVHRLARPVALLMVGTASCADVDTDDEAINAALSVLDGVGLGPADPAGGLERARQLAEDLQREGAAAVWRYGNNSVDARVRPYNGGWFGAAVVDDLRRLHVACTTPAVGPDGLELADATTERFSWNFERRWTNAEIRAHPPVAIERAEAARAAVLGDRRER